MMKKELILSIFLMSIVILAGCVQQFDESQQKELDLIKELQNIERELGGDNTLDDLDNQLEDVIEETDEPVEEEVDTSALQHIEVEETELVIIQATANDADGDNVTYMFSAPLDENGNWQTNYSDAGEYIVTVTASDGVNIAEQRILLVVHKRNAPPHIAGIPTTLEADEGEVIQLTPDVTDPNKDIVTITFSPPFDEEGTWETDHKSAGEYDITITASDGEAETTQDLLLTINDVNLAPVIANLEKEITVKEGDTITIDPEVTDEDGDVVELSISEPVGDDGVWETGYKDNGAYIVTITASDGKDTVSLEVKITVEDVNVPPQITAIKRG